MGKFETSSKLLYFNKNIAVSPKGMCLLYIFVFNRRFENVQLLVM